VTVRLVATDLDGTLVHSDGTITPRTRTALLAAESVGIDVVFATGRPLRWARDAVPGSHFAVETVDGIALETGFLERYPVPRGARRGTFDRIADVPAYKLLARHEELGAQEFWDAALACVSDLVEVTWSSATTLLEMSALGVTKASTLELFCSERGITAADVVAFGDMPNDLPMLTWAGTSYAMANAHPSVREIATHVAGTNDEDGVAEVIEQLLDTGEQARGG
jgi:hydroxymethylpyrimidine pyrophosphatase-like HAD family hydrolase